MMVELVPDEILRVKNGHIQGGNGWVDAISIPWVASGFAHHSVFDMQTAVEGLFARSS